MSTLRRHLEAIRLALSERDEPCCVDSPMCSCAYEAVCDAHAHAVAALAILDEAGRHEVISAETGDSFPTVFRLVRDSEPSA